MAISFTSLVVRHERRLRLLFSNSVAAGAFSTSLYAIVSDDGVGSAPNVSAALAVPNTPNGVDLALGSDLAGGAHYTITATAVPAVDASTSPAESHGFMLGEPDVKANEEQGQDDIAALVYGEDLVWTGDDYLESPTGDLATISGMPNVQGAIVRRLTGQYGLPWKPDYGVQAQDFVNGPSPNAITLRGRLVRQALSDDRVSSAKADFQADADVPGDAFFPVAVTLIGNAGSGDQLGLTIPVPKTS